ncbi:MAG: Hpt domain-containing protein, partial [Lachnospiraceae bacterium]|nr:Hpt domain-containing protein [Lachnospiraceae bacterium]
MDVSQYLEIFLDESREHLQNLNTQIMNLEQNPEDMDTVNEIFRAAHSLKGMAGTMGYKRMQNLTHDMENVFSEVRNGTIKIQPNMVDILFQCLDALEEYVNTIQETSDEGTNDNAPIIKLLNDCLNGGGGDAAPAEGGQPEAAAPAEGEAAPAGDAAGDLGDPTQNWKAIKLDDSEVSVLQEAKNQGKNVFGLTVKVQESCILKAARAFLVFKSIEEAGEILVSNPSAQDIEDEKFEFHFSIICITERSLQEVLDGVKAVSEIEGAEGGEIDNPASMLKGGSGAEEAASQEAPKEEKKEETK